MQERMIYSLCDAEQKKKTEIEDDEAKSPGPSARHRSGNKFIGIQ